MGAVEISGHVDPIGFEAPGAEFRQTVRVEPGENHIETTFPCESPACGGTWDRGEAASVELSINCAGNVERLRSG